MVCPPDPPDSDSSWRGAIDLALAPLHSAVAHDLRSPLNAIRLNLALVRRALERDAASATRWLDVVDEETRRLSTLLDAYLMLTAASGETSEPREGDLAALIRRGEPILHCLALRRDVELQLELSPARGAFSDNAMRRASLAAIGLALAEARSGGSLRVETIQSAPGEGVIDLVLTGESLPAAAQLETLVAPLGARVQSGGVSAAANEIRISFSSLDPLDNPEEPT